MDIKDLIAKAAELGYVIHSSEDYFAVGRINRDNRLPEIFGGRDYLSGRPVPWGINAAGYGTLSIEETGEFIKDLQKGQEMARLMNEYQGL